MSVGTGFIGREVDFQFGGSTVAGMVSKALSINNTPLDTSDDTSDGNAEYLAIPGRKDITISLSVKVKNLDIMLSILNNVSQVYTSLMTFPDGTNGSTLAGDVFLTSASYNGEHEGLFMLDLELTYSGAVTFTAAT